MDIMVLSSMAKSSAAENPELYNFPQWQKNPEN